MEYNKVNMLQPLPRDNFVPEADGFIPESHTEKVVRLKEELSMAEKGAKKSIGQRLLNELEKNVTVGNIAAKTGQELLKTPQRIAHFAGSVAQAPEDLARLATGNAPLANKIPFTGEGSLQSQFFLNNQAAIKKSATKEGLGVGDYASLYKAPAKAALEGSEILTIGTPVVKAIQAKRATNYLLKNPELQANVKTILDSSMDINQYGNGAVQFPAGKALPKTILQARIDDVVGKAAMPVESGGLGMSRAQASGLLDSLRGKVYTSLEDMAVDAQKLLSPVSKETVRAIQAVQPVLTGKDLKASYKQGLGNPRGLFTRQSVSANPETVRIGQNLSDLNFSSNPVRNIKMLGDNVGKTEQAIQNLPDYATAPLNKAELGQKLEGLKEAIPREYRGIRDSKSIFDDVIDFGKEQLAAADDTIKGGREQGRIAFDQGAKMQYPSAFKNGHIDMKTPAGRAIKLVRDTFNEHLYETAPQGTELQSLVGREWNLLQAIDNVAGQAVKTHGKNFLGAIIRRHPVLSIILGTSIGGGVTGKAVRAVTNTQP